MKVTHHLLSIVLKPQVGGNGCTVCGTLAL
jgi:hypothetical protein